VAVPPIVRMSGLHGPTDGGAVCLTSSYKKDKWQDCEELVRRCTGNTKFGNELNSSSEVGGGGAELSRQTDMTLFCLGLAVDSP
jgi:hypothetical protein